MILAVDPGLRQCGVSTWYDDGTLQQASLLRGPTSRQGPEQWRGMACAVKGWGIDYDRAKITRVVVERMPAYRTDLPSRTLLLHELTAVGAWIMALFPWADCEAVFPRDWEGGGLKRDKRHPDKDPIVQRVKSRLSAAELARVELPARSLETNVWDAVGIGLWAVGRFGYKRVIARS